MKSRFRWVPAIGSVATAAAIAVCAALLWAPAASADITFCPSGGSGAGQCESPVALAVDEASGEVYVCDAGNNRVDVFDEDGGFLRAFGWDVAPEGAPGDTVGDGLETCTTVCKAGISGAGAGQLNGGRSLAVDNDPASSSYRDVFVIDRNARVQRFSGAGAFSLMFGDGVNQSTGGDVCTAISGDTCKAGVSGGADGQLSTSFIKVAVGKEGAVFVGDRIERSIGPGVVAIDTRVQEFAPAGAFEGVFASDPGGDFNPGGIATDGAGNVYLGNLEGVRKYDPSGACIGFCATPLRLADANISIRDVAIDRASGDILVADSTGPGNTAIYEYDEAGAPVRVHYGNGTLRSFTESLGAYLDGGGERHLFAVDSAGPRRVARLDEEPPGPVVLPFDTRATPVGNVRATLRARVNPEGAATTVRYQYIEKAGYEKDIGEGGDGFTDAFESQPAQTSPDPIPANFTNPGDVKPTDTSFQIACPDPEEELQAKIEAGECLEAETGYVFRAVADNGDAVAGPVGEFTTLAPLKPGPLWATQVGADSARLHAQLDPSGIPTGLEFEYVDEASYESEGFAKAHVTAPLDFGLGEGTTQRSILVTGLAPGTTYRYRYLAHDLFGDFPSAARTLSTTPGALGGASCANEALRAGPGSQLPDCRAYELVSPIDKDGAGIRVPTENTLAALGATFARVDQATPQGGSLAYATLHAFGDPPSSPYASQYLASRDGASGWSSGPVSAPREGISMLTSPGSAYTFALTSAFSEDLCSEWLVQDTDLALAPGAPPAVPNLYRRRNCGAGAGSYELLSSIAPPGFGKQIEPTGVFSSTILGGFSADGSVSVFKSRAALTPGAMTVPVETELSCDISVTGAKVTYRWLRNGEPIAPKSEAINPQYKTKAADAGKAIQCQVFAENESEDKGSGGGFAGATQVTDPAEVVEPMPATAPPIAPAVIPAPEADAALEVGGPGAQTLTCDPGAAGWQGEPAFSYQWYRNGKALDKAAEITRGSQTATFTLAAGELASAAAFQCVVKGSNAGGAVSRASGSLPSSPGPSPAAPEPRPTEGRFARVYLHDGSGALHLVSVLPGGRAAHTEATVGTALLGNKRFFDSVAGAVSADGSRIFWSAQSAGQTKGPATLYLRTDPASPGAATYQISSGKAIFRGADPSATKALYSEGETLIEVDVDAAIAGAGGARSTIAGGVKGVMGMSEDLSRVYLVSSEDRDGGGPAQAGQFNLYLYEAGGGFSFVAGLSGAGWKAEPAEDESLSADARSISPFPVNRSSRVSADGLHAAFMSQSGGLAEEVAGYDNADAQSGKADAEVYLYDAGEGELRCVSCNPSGARPAGKDFREGGEEAWMVAQIPGWENQWHASRLLSGDGERLFFESLDPLVPRDTNGRQDVYEWERAQSGAECEALGAERHVPANGGCLSLISSGRSGADSEVLDASASGDDVFFTTASSLIAADPGLFDIYDARVLGGFPEVDEGKGAECEGAACQSPPAAPAQPTPGSSSFEGEGNLAKHKVRRCPKGRRKVRRGGKVRCLRKPRHRAGRHRHHHRRAAR